MRPILFHNGLDRDLDTFLGSLFGQTAAPTEVCEPATQAVPMDLYETDTSYEAYLDVPGLSRDDVKISVEESSVTIRGERPARAQSTNEKHFRRVERWTGAFAQTLNLPTTIDASKIEAQLKDGVLKLVLPKREQAKPRTITIN